ncbi:DUF4192 family protein, partial [Kineococcus rubinsiae]|uniref:DUF4192 family protein n=1 Tax=Kineococcus rubinsiae TaxID=2609562 RepID=UPI0014307CC6
RLAVDLARHGTPAAAGAGDQDVPAAAAVDPTAAALAVAAWTWWSAGDGVRAGACAVEALRRDPGQGLASLVGRALQHGLPPAWQQAAAPAPAGSGPDRPGTRAGGTPG